MADVPLRGRLPQISMVFLLLGLASPNHGGFALWAQKPETSNSSEVEPKRLPRLSREELEKKAAEYGGKPPSDGTDEPQKTPKLAIAACVCQPSGELRCKEELDGYLPGAFTHPRLKEFVHSVATLLKLNEPTKKARVFRFIQTIGQTDGLENRGVCCWENLVRTENDCSSIMPAAGPKQRLDERLLGLARACVMRKALELEFQDPLLGLPQDWPTDAEDIETGGLVGDPYRKVTVEIWIKDGCLNEQISSE